MALQIFKEQLTGKYDGVTPATLLPKGWLSGGENMRRAGPGGGWKVRLGCDTHNTTAIGAASVLSLHKFVHPRNLDSHFIAQCNATLVDATNTPPTVGTTFGTDITNSKTISSSKAGFSDMIEELWLYADGGVPLMWGGSNPFCTGFLAYDSSTTSYVDHTKYAKDNRTDTAAIILGAAGDIAYVCSPEIADGIKLTLGTSKNSNSVTATVKSWQAGAWSDRSATDGTASGGATLAQTGTMTWTASTSDTMRVLGGIMGYWYQITFSGALSASVDVTKCQVTFDLAVISNKWDGVYQTPLAVRFYDASATQYIDLSGKLTNESTSQYFNLDAATTSDFIYVKSAEPLTGIGLGVVDGYENTAAGSNLDQVEYWDGDSWNAITTGITDETLDTAGAISLSQSGTFWWNATSLTVKKRIMPFDSIPGYWYRLSWDVAFDNASDDVRLFFVALATFPETLPQYDGVIEFKGRAFLWGDPEYPNRLRYSCYGRPDCFSGSDSGYTDPFGDMAPVKCVIRFYNELLVFKADSVWLLEGYSPATFGITRIADTIGLASPKSAVLFETGSPIMHKDEPLSIAVWQDTEAVYALDGRKPRKVSGPVEHYFNPEYSTTVIAAASIQGCQAFADKNNNEYHFLIPNGGTGHGTELVYNPYDDEWYPPWDRTVGGANDYLVCGIDVRGSDNRRYTLGGGSAGRVYLLETDTADRDASDADVAISHSIKTRAVSALQELSPTLAIKFRMAWIEAKARSAGTVTTTLYLDLATSGSTIATPAAISLVRSGYNLITDGVSTDQARSSVFQLEWSVATVDVALEIYSFIYLLEALGKIAQE